MKKIKFSFLFLCIIFSSTNIIVYAKNAEQTIIFNPKQVWLQFKIDNVIETSDGTSFSFIPVDQSASNWKQKIRTMLLPYDKNSGISAIKVMKMQIEDAQKICRSVNSEILSQTDNSVTYTLNVDKCSNGEKQVQIGKSFDGKEGVHNVMYSAVVGQITKNDYNNAKRLIMTASLGRNPASENDLLSAKKQVTIYESISGKVRNEVYTSKDNEFSVNVPSIKDVIVRDKTERGITSVNFSHDKYSWMHDGQYVVDVISGMKIDDKTIYNLPRPMMAIVETEHNAKLNKMGNCKSITIHNTKALRCVGTFVERKVKAIFIGTSYTMKGKIINIYGLEPYVKDGDSYKFNWNRYNKMIDSIDVR